MADRAAALAEWAALLDLFEHGDPASTAWEPASAPLPPELETRARDVLASLQARMTDLGRERDETRAHLTALRRVPAGGAEHAAYLDLDG